FLRNPQPIRPQKDWKTGLGTVILRMPRFNMSDEEAMALVNYFAAVDKVSNPGEGLSYPYLAIEQHEDQYWQRRSQEYVTRTDKTKLDSRLKKLEATWDRLLPEQIADKEANSRAAEAAVKTAKPDEKKDAERLRDALQKELKTLEAQPAK